MRKKKLYYFILPLLLAIFLLFQFYNGKQEIKNRDNSRRIILSKHAKCRMECRDIDLEEIKGIIANGKIDKSRTRKSQKGISYAVDGESDDGQDIRVVYSPHNDEIVIVTVIDTKKNWPCACN